MMQISKYLIKYHVFFRDRALILIEQTKKLKTLLPRHEYIKHDAVKLLWRVRRATRETIAQDPTRPDYRLKGSLSKFKRFKQGMGRYRIIFCYASTPPLILYCYLNDKDHLRKDGDSNDPYFEFAYLLNKGIFSADPHDPQIQKFIRHEL